MGDLVDRMIVSNSCGFWNISENESIDMNRNEAQSQSERDCKLHDDTRIASMEL